MKHAITVRVSKKRDPNVRHSEGGRLKSDVIQKTKSKVQKASNRTDKNKWGQNQTAPKRNGKTTTENEEERKPETKLMNRQRERGRRGLKYTGSDD